MGGGFLVVCLSGLFMVWAGWGLLPAENLGRLVVLHCGVGWLVVCVGVEDTPAAAGWWWWVPPRALCVWGWHAVGVLGQCALVA